MLEDAQLETKAIAAKRRQLCDINTETLIKCYAES